jgi:hypothetical protein
MQLLDRVMASLDVSYMLKSSLAFGSTPQDCFLVIGIRHIPIERQDTPSVSLYLFQVAKENMISIWMAVNTVEPLSFLTEDAPLICHGLATVKLNPWLCRVHLKDWSQSRVYDITLPKKCTWPKNIKRNEYDEETSSSCVGVASDKPDFAMKIVLNTGEFHREVEALVAVCARYLICGIPFEGDMTPGVSSLIIPKSCKDALAVYEKKRKDDRGGWWRQTPHPLGGGSLLMMIGEPLPDQLDTPTRHTVFNQITQSLHHMHHLQYYHTDIRLPNILKFGSHYELIDFGEAIKEGETRSTEGFSDGRRSLVSDPRSSFMWDRGHDVEMLCRAVYSIPQRELDLQQVNRKRKR